MNQDGKQINNHCHIQQPLLFIHVVIHLAAVVTTEYITMRDTMLQYCYKPVRDAFTIRAVTLVGTRRAVNTPNKQHAMIHDRLALL